jgi:hypothetical protein
MLYFKKIQYIHRLTEECIGLCSSVNREIYGTYGRDVGQDHAPSIFVGDVEPMNINCCIRRHYIP